MSRKIIVSNRLPINIQKKNNKWTFEPSIGGLATGLNSIHQNEDSLWVGWSGIEDENLSTKDIKEITKKLKNEYKCIPFFLTKKEIELYYNCFSNKTIWPLFHYFTAVTEYNAEYWDYYQIVNNKVACELKKVMGRYDTVWIQDYQLMLLPQLIKEGFPNAKIGFFLHIPFPSFEVFRLLPWRIEILKGMLGADLIGFHTYDYVRHFISCVRRILQYDAKLSTITTENRQVKIDAFPMGIDYKKYNEASEKLTIQREIQALKSEINSTKVILSIDRLDYTKGIPHRLEAYDKFLTEHPEWKKKVTFILIVAPSRTMVDTYSDLKKELDELVSRINSKHGSIGWVPIWYYFQTFHFNRLIALYKISDILLVTPIRDGMNLIAKEYIATKNNKKGVVILSETAGAVCELGEAIVINPNNSEEISEAIAVALKMPTEEQIKRNTIMHKRLALYDVNYWANDFIEKLDEVVNQKKDIDCQVLTKLYKKKLITAYTKAKKRLLFLDYDGTLVNFHQEPEMASPDTELINIVKKLAKEKNTEIVIISGRDKNTLNKWFKDLAVNLVAGHGVWIKKKSGRWALSEALNSDWKEKIFPIMELFVNRTPGSFIEDKQFSIAWHYRKCDVDLAFVRGSELKDALLGMTNNLNLQILEGNKVLEIRDAAVNKGKAASLWFDHYDFMMAIGDDWTDEDLFTIMPDNAYSIKVGYGYTNAKYNIANVQEVRTLLKDILDPK
ncbi:bifunctional alpha,alpha-trehalose-phosphate synthase (UDP-forming)/trehalose-phosphatase [Candidatus Margulisiibacteriota bacterium]